MLRLLFFSFLFFIIQNNVLAVDLNGIWLVDNNWEIRLFQEGDKVNSVVTLLSEFQKDRNFLKKGDNAIFGTINDQIFTGKIATSPSSENIKLCSSKIDYFSDLSLNILQEGSILKGFKKIIFYKEDCTIDRESLQEIILKKRSFDSRKKYRADANKDKLVSLEDAIFALQINAGAIDNSKLIKHGIVNDFEYLIWKRKVEGVCCDNIYLKNENVKFETVDITVSLRNNYSAFLYTTNGIIYGDIIESGEEVKTVKGVEHMYDVSDITQHNFNSENQPWVIYTNTTTGIVLYKQGNSYGGIRILNIYQKQIDEWYHQYVSYEYWHGFPGIVDFSLAPDFNK